MYTRQHLIEHVLSGNASMFVRQLLFAQMSFHVKHMQTIMLNS